MPTDTRSHRYNSLRPRLTLRAAKSARRGPGAGSFEARLHAECELGLRQLRAYRKEWDEARGVCGRTGRGMTRPRTERTPSSPSPAPAARRLLPSRPGSGASEGWSDRATPGERADRLRGFLECRNLCALRSGLGSAPESLDRARGSGRFAADGRAVCGGRLKLIGFATHTLAVIPPPSGWGQASLGLQGTCSSQSSDRPKNSAHTGPVLRVRTTCSTFKEAASNTAE